RLVDDREPRRDGRAARDQRALAAPVSLPLGPLAVFGLLKELRVAAADDKPLAVGGALAQQLVKELVRGAEPHVVRVAGPEGAAAYVHVLAGAPRAEDEAALKRAHRARVPAVALARQR